MKILIILIGVLFFLPSCKNAKQRFYASEQLPIGAEGDTAWSIGMRKYTGDFNSYRTKHDLPILPPEFYLLRSGADYAEWKNPANKPPAYDSKIVTWYGWGTKEPFLVWENTLFVGEKGEVLSFRYGRKLSDSLIMHFNSIDSLYIKETDSLYWRSYRFFDSSGARTIISKESYDSVLKAWAIR